MVTSDANTNDVGEKTNKTITDKIIQWETVGLPEEEVVPFFQELIDTGLAWTLQGSYGRSATQLIEQGLCSHKEDA